MSGAESWVLLGSIVALLVSLGIWANRQAAKHGGREPSPGAQRILSGFYRALVVRWGFSAVIALVVALIALSHGATGAAATAGVLGIGALFVLTWALRRERKQ